MKQRYLEGLLSKVLSLLSFLGEYFKIFVPFVEKCYFDQEIKVSDEVVMKMRERIR